MQEDLSYVRVPKELEGYWRRRRRRRRIKKSVGPTLPPHLVSV